MALFVDPKMEPCQRCYFADWQRKVLKRIEDVELEVFSQTCRICGFSEEWWGFYDSEVLR